MILSELVFTDYLYVLKEWNIYSLCDIDSLEKIIVFLFLRQMTVN